MGDFEADNSKRLRTTGNAEEKAADGKPVTRSELTGLFDEFKDEIMSVANKQVQESVIKMGQQATSTMQRFLTKYDQSVQVQFSDIEKRLGDLSVKMERFEAGSHATSQAVASLSQGLPAAEAATPDLSHARSLELLGSWEREIDPTIIQIGTSEQVTRTDIIGKIDEWLQCLGLNSKELYNIDGDEGTTGRKFTVRFTGQTGLASRRVSKALAHLRTPTGWTRLEADIPAAASGDGSLTLPARKVKLFPPPDKCPAQVQREVCGKKLFNICKAQFPNQRLHFQRSTGTVFSNWINMVRVKVYPDAPAAIEWNNSSPLVAQMDTDARNSVAARFRSQLPSGGEESWITI